MYVYMDGEEWAADGQPPVTDQHGFMTEPSSGGVYGRLLTEEEDQVVTRALLQWRGWRELPLNPDVI